MARPPGAVGLMSGQARGELEALAHAVGGEVDADAMAAAIVEHALSALRQFGVMACGTRVDVVARSARGKARR